MFYVTSVLGILLPMTMPVVAIALIMYFRSRNYNKRADLILAAMEHGHDMKDMLKMMQEKQKGVKERQVNRLLWGCLFTFLGILIPVIELLTQGSLQGLDGAEMLIFVIPLSVGLAFLIAFAVGQRMLKSEMEREERDAKEGKE